MINRKKIYRKTERKTERRDYLRIIGIADSHFTTKDNTEIKGKNIYLSQPIDPTKGKGESAERIFLSEAKLSGLDFTPAVGMVVEVLYNRYGKVATFRMANDNLLID